MQLQLAANCQGSRGRRDPDGDVPGVQKSITTGEAFPFTDGAGPPPVLTDLVPLQVIARAASAGFGRLRSPSQSASSQAGFLPLSCGETWLSPPNRWHAHRT